MKQMIKFEVKRMLRNPGSKESIPLRPPRERTRGLAPRPRLHWQSVARRAARAAQSDAVYVASPRIPTTRYRSQPRLTIVRRG